MMKVVCIAILLALTVQLQLTHDQENLFAKDKNFVVISNIDGDTVINGAKFNFTMSKLSFEDGCGTYTTYYEIRTNNAISIAKNRWTFVKAATCGSNKDWKIKELLKKTVKYNYGDTVDFLDADSKVLLTLKKA